MAVTGALLWQYLKKQLRGSLQNGVGKIAPLVSTPGRRRLVAAAGLFASGGGLYFYKRKQELEAIANKQLADLERRSQNFKLDTEAKRKPKPEVNKEFVRKLRVLLKIVLPGVRSKEFGLLALHTGFLVARTFVSIYVAQLDGSIVKAIVDRDVWEFAWRMTRWLAIAVPATYVNSMIRYLEAKLSIAFRTRLVDHVYTLYMKDETYYRVDNVDSRMQNADQCLTEDVAQFCNQLSHLYSQISKPLFDIVLMVGQLLWLARQRSGSGMQIHYPYMLAGVVIAVTGYILRISTPPFGRLVAEEARRYGHLRAVHSRLITHSEEIAFYGGHKVEENSVREAYRLLVSHMNSIYKKRIWYTMLEQFLMKYVWSASGLVMIAIPTLIRDKDKETAPTDGSAAAKAVESDDTISIRTQDFVTARGLLVSAADAMERLMSSWKEVTELAGRTARVSQMIEIFQDVSAGRYVKNVSGKAAEALAQKGVVMESSTSISLENVPIVTPNGDTLVDRLNVTIKPGMHLLITGPNGCGKSSLFRILGGMWGVHGGRLVKPPKGDMFYIPQRPYLCEGTLREQFIYPHTVEDFKAKGFTDDSLLEILGVVNLAHVVKREGGWDAVNDWRDVLSGGEKQRVGMARVFYHRPKWAILDECTSAVSLDVEGRMYLHAKALGITLLTVTHRPSLWKYHTHLLQFDGQGGVTLSQLNAEARLSLHEEKAKLENQLSGVPKMHERLQALCEMLGESSIHVKPPSDILD